MSLALNKPKLDNLAGDIWKSAERLRGKFKGKDILHEKRAEYGQAIFAIAVCKIGGGVREGIF